MKNNASRDKILGKIRQNKRTGIDGSKADFSVEHNNDIFFRPDDLVQTFKNEVETVSGKCLICKSESEQFSLLKEYLRQFDIHTIYCTDENIILLLDKYAILHTSEAGNFEPMQAGITAAEVLVARTGSVVVSSGGDSGRKMFVFPPVHIVLAKQSQLVNFPSEATDVLQQKYRGNLPSQISFITGPSRTADIEKTLVLGAHGPKEFVVFLLLQ